MDWSTKKFHYKIINIDDERKTIGFVHKKLGDLEEFVSNSGLHVKKIERTGPNSFTVEVSTDSAWKI